LQGAPKQELENQKVTFEEPFGDWTVNAQDDHNTISLSGTIPYKMPLRIPTKPKRAKLLSPTPLNNKIPDPIKPYAGQYADPCNRTLDTSPAPVHKVELGRRKQASRGPRPPRLLKHRFTGQKI